MQTQRIIPFFALAVLAAACGLDDDAPKQQQPPALNSAQPTLERAKFLSAHEMQVTLSMEGPVDTAAIRVTDHKGRPVAVKAILRKDGAALTLESDTPFDWSRNYEISYKNVKKPVHIPQQILNTEFVYSGSDLGATLKTDGSVDLALWSPPAVEVAVEVFAADNATRSLGAHPLKRTAKGVWRAHLDPANFGVSSLDGCFYQYRVTAYGQTLPALDPYARSMAAFDPASTDPVGKGAFVRLDSERARPATTHLPFRNSDIMRNRVDMIAYEMHVRDFTISPDSGVEAARRGTYLGFTDKIPHLTDLGITHVQLMPIMNFFTVREDDRAFSNGTSPKINYNWGYDPQNYFTPEGWYSSNAADPYARIREFRDLVGALHDAGIGVILDVVYNHTYVTSTFENVCPGCYYRLDAKENISTHTGAGPSVESRNPMVRKLIIDSLRHMTQDYGVNGFRFDLMGFMDATTLAQARAALGPDVILQGEAWEFTDLPAAEAVTKSNLPFGTEVSAFSDTTRDGIGGWQVEGGFLQGLFGRNDRVRSAVVGNLAALFYPDDASGDGKPDARLSSDTYDRFARTPVENLGFLSIHDGPTLWDKIHVSYKAPEDSTEERLRINKLAAAMLFTTQGRVIIHGGEEIARTKPVAAHDPAPDRTISREGLIPDSDIPGVVEFHENSYRSSDFTNMMRWDRKDDPVYAPLYSYYRGLIAMRRALEPFRLASSGDVAARVRFIGENPVQPPPPDLAQRAGYRSFAEVPELTIRFVHGPAGKTYYAAGEVHPATSPDKNPKENPFVVKFDAAGKATLALSREAVAKLDLKSWSEPDALNLKLVEKPTEWVSPATAYSAMGNNAILADSIHRGNVITVDLAVKDHRPGVIPITDTSYVAYEIAGPAGTFTRLLVAHNGAETPAVIPAPQLARPACWKVLLDADAIDFEEGLADSAVVVRASRLTVPRKSSAVLGDTCPRG